MTRGKFVAIEGNDANGKQTQSKLLAEKLDALLLSFPRYETEIGKLIAANLKGGWATYKPNGNYEGTANAIVRQALFTLDRYDAADGIKRALDSGKCVVADRYWVSGLMYGASDLVDAGMLERVHRCLPQPDVWVLLDVPVEESFRRRPERQDVYERDREKLEGIRVRYCELFAQREQESIVNRERAIEFQYQTTGYAFENTYRQKWVIIDGVGTVEQVHERVTEAIR